MRGDRGMRAFGLVARARGSREHVEGQRQSRISEQGAGVVIVKVAATAMRADILLHPVCLVEEKWLRGLFDRKSRDQQL